MTLDAVHCHRLVSCQVPYDCLRKDKLATIKGSLNFQPGEKVLAVYQGKPFKATIAVSLQVSLHVLIILTFVTCFPRKARKPQCRLQNLSPVAVVV